MEILLACGRSFVLLAFKSKNRCASGREPGASPCRARLRATLLQTSAFRTGRASPSGRRPATSLRSASPDVTR
jgi:hypothetical protein